MADSLKYQLAINEQAKQGSGKKKKEKNHHIRTHAGRKITSVMNSISPTLYSTGQVWVSFSNVYGEITEAFKEAE